MMKRQYHTSGAGAFRTRIDIYHDGTKISTEIFWDDEADAQVEHLEKQGYTRGFTRTQLHEEVKKLKHLLDHFLIEEEKPND